MLCFSCINCIYVPMQYIYIMLPPRPHQLHETGTNAWTYAHCCRCPCPTPLILCSLTHHQHSRHSSITGWSIDCMCLGVWTDIALIKQYAVQHKLCQHMLQSKSLCLKWVTIYELGLASRNALSQCVTEQAAAWCVPH